jgi:hypothetical protein
MDRCGKVEKEVLIEDAFSSHDEEGEDVGEEEVLLFG